MPRWAILYRGDVMGGWFQDLGPQAVGDGGDGKKVAPIVVAEIC